MARETTMPVISTEAALVGVVPMAGRAARLAGLPCSKEILPVDCTGGGQPRPVCEHLLDELRVAGIENLYLVIRDGKWDIPACLGDGSQLGVHIAYLMMGLSWGTPYSIDQAYPFVRERRVVVGFPDMCFADSGMFARALEYQAGCGADVVLGLFPADRPHKSDMVDMDVACRVTQIQIKPAATNLHHTWGIAVWTPVFTELLHRFLLSHRLTAAESPELYVGDVVRAAMEAGLDVRGVQVSARPFVDIGTLEDLQRVPG
jgi:glucose-1-phosphate thymidylyltransferase